MQSFILLGSSKNKLDYLSSFQKKHKVPDYYIVRYLETFKIADARTLQKSLSAKLKEGEARIIIIQNATIDAQNAILKTLEELPEKTFVFFLCGSREDILPTIASRSSFIVLELEKKEQHDDIEKEIRSMIGTEGFEGRLFVLLDLLGATLEEQEMESALLSLRKVLLEEVSKNSEKILPLFLCLKILDKNYKLSKTNNINKRMVLENSLLVLGQSVNRA